MSGLFEGSANMDRASSSDSSSDSPPRLTGMEDDILSETPETFQNYGKLESSMANLKRHFSGHPIAVGGPERAREPKSRRKESRAGGHGGAPGGLWEQGSSQVRVRDELVDSGLVEQLRNQFGDPFDDLILKKAADTDK